MKQNRDEIILIKIKDAKDQGSFFLDLSSLGIKTLPTEIGILTELKELNLSNNSLSQLPNEINNLYRLQELDLSNNSFNHTNEIGFSFPSRLPIKTLNLSNNNFHKLPEDIFFLDFLENVNLEGNPIIEGMPQEIIDAGLLAIENFNEEVQLSKYSDSIFEAKLIFVGQGDVGKTTLMKKLINKNFKVKEGLEESTHGININKWVLSISFDMSFLYDTYELASYYDYGYEISEDGILRESTLNIWDFGGQEIYYSTHQFFLTKRSIYVFVWDARKEEEYKSFEYWLNIIRVLSDGCPVIIVMNKSDKRIKYIDQKSLKINFPSIFAFHQVSCINDEGLDDLKESIISAFTSLAHLGDRLPNAWVDIRIALKGLNKNFISYDEYISICRQNNISQKRADYLSDYYHDLGDFIIYKNDAILKNTIILNPEWCTKAFYQLIDNNKIQQRQGRFSLEDLEYIWDKRFYPKEKYLEIIRLMERFEICFSLIGSDFYIIPELLKNDIEGINLDNFINESELSFEYSFKFIPSGIIARFICRAYFLIEKNSFWKTGVVLNHEESTALVLSEYINKKVKIFVKGYEKVEMLGIIRKEFEIIFQSINLKKGEDFEEMIPCKCIECARNNKPHFFKFKTLKLFRNKQKELITCEKSAEDVEIELLLRGYEKKTIVDSLLNHLIIACSQLQGNYKIIDGKEDSRNSFISNVLNNRGFNAKDQSKWGTSPTQKSQGEIDIKVENSIGLTIGIIEALNLSVFDKNKIVSHFDKLFNYDANGIKDKFLVVYSEAGEFIDLWEKYQTAIKTSDLLLNAESPFKDISEKYSYGNGLKVGQTINHIKAQKYRVYHIFINMMPIIQNIK